MKTKERLLAVALLVAMVLPAAAAEGAGVLTVAVQGEPQGLNLILTPAADSYQIVMYNIIETLLRYTPEGELVPWLASGYEVDEVGEETWYTFTLRSDVLFHDGTSLEADDVKYTFGRLLDPIVASPNAANFEFVERIEVLGPQVVRFVTGGRAAPFLGYLASAKGAGIVPEGADMDALRTAPVGTGPFLLKEWVPGDHLTLAKNDAYWRPGVPALDEVRVRFVPDPAAMLAALRAGDIDLADKMLPEHALELAGDERFTVATGSMNTVQLLALNHARSPFDNILVRRAIYHAIDRDEIIEVTVGRRDWGAPLGSHLVVPNPYYVDLVDMYPHDPERARRLLAQAGYPDGFETTLYLPSVYEFHVRAGELIAAQLAEVGIRVSIDLIDFAQWLDLVYTQWDYDMTVIGHDQGPEPAAALAKPLERLRDDGSPGYYFQYGSPYVRGLLSRAKDTFDIGERKILYAMVQTAIASDVMAVWLQDIPQFEVMRREVSGFVRLPMYLIDFSTLTLTPIP